MRILHRLFEKHPSWEALFSKYMKEGSTLLENPQFQEDVECNLMNSFGFIVDNMDNEAFLTTELYQLGSRHTVRNVTRVHFTSVIGPLIETLRSSNGPSFDCYTEAAWKQLLDFAMGTMGDGEEGNHMTTQPTPTIT
jgi:hemoglobin-like flavoprotein